MAGGAAHGAGDGVVAESPTPEEPPPPRPGLVRTGWIWWLAIALQLGGAVVLFGNLVAGIATIGAGFLVFLTWTYLAVMNTARANPGTTHSSPPRPMAAVVWWLAPALWFAAVFALGTAIGFFSESSGWSEEDRQTVVMLGVLVALVVLLSVIIQPYRYLARATRWVGGNGTRWLWWFWGPVLAGMVSTVMQYTAAQIWVTSEEGTGQEAFAIVIVWIALCLPPVVQVVQGYRAKRELERATEMTYEGPQDPLRGLDPAMIAERVRAAAAAQAGWQAQTG